MEIALVDRALGALDELLFPSICVVCGESVTFSSSRRLDLCPGCAGDLPDNRRACVLCAEPLPNAPAHSICGQCLRKPPKYEHAFCAYRYAYPIDHLLRAFKFHGRLAYGCMLGELLARSLQASTRDAWPDIIVPVPLSDVRFRERGFNQAIELGRMLEARLGIPLRADLVMRTRNTREQAGLDRVARRKNIRGAFSMIGSRAAKHVAILDDVVTTGSTVNELARLLKRAGAKRVEVWAVARTPR